MLLGILSNAMLGLATVNLRFYGLTLINWRGRVGIALNNQQIAGGNLPLVIR
ncbi:hypothetical protein SM12BL1_07620 [Serratia marcescens]|nr:hypothetical protein SM12BL1_07620 [Serratia marcescens]BEN61917.1 hypothetical protein SMKC069_46080 [Serratia marcescens]CUZ15973.1 Uncharacterised protein [Serratia marcescens]